MITTGDARNILFSACKGVGIKDMHTSWAIPEGKVNRERIVVITPPEQTSDTYWENCFVAVKNGHTVLMTDPHTGTGMRISAAKKM